MKSLRFEGWRRLAAPPLAAWLSACSAHGGANQENLQSARSTGAAAALLGGSGGSGGLRADGTDASAAEGGRPSRPEMGEAAGGGGQTSSAPPAAVGGASDGATNTGGAGSPWHAAAGGSTAAGGGAGEAGAGGGGSAAAGSGAAGSAAVSVTFGQVYAVLMNGCSCHAAGAGGLDLGSRALAHANLVGIDSGACSGELRVAPGAPARSVLVHALEHTDLAGCSVPQMPAGGPMLGAAELATVRAWIAAGARDD